MTPPNEAKAPETDNYEPPYCVLSERAKISTMLAASFAGMISPMSASIYYPALPTLANDMHVSNTLINLTVTTYMIFQGIAPSFTGSLSDVYGRRPAYIISFTTYVGANIGLALQNNYAALMVLRCLQACGSSGTIAIGSAIVADLSTRAERGKYIGYATIGMTLGPALGPVVGGLLSQFLGWRWIFWFLTILGGVLLVGFVVFVPETCRAVVGNGSVGAQRWNRTVWGILRRKGEGNERGIDYETVQKGGRRPNPLTSVRIATEKETGLILLYGALLYCGFMIVISTLSAQMESRFGFNAIQIGLCYLPFGVGTLTSRWTVGRALDWNFKREADRQGLSVAKNKQQDIREFDIEAARLKVTIPIVYAACLSIIAYGWVMDYQTSLAGPLVMLFFTGHLTTGAFTTLSTLVVDVHRQSPATAVAANNLVRCLLGAGAAAVGTPLIDRIGIGWTATFVAGVWAVFSPILWVVYRWGHAWREEMRVKGERDEGRGE
ncbi:putative MFS transporter [Aspergillus steynii IBT 23096]|uniref:Putative MFS transporter n=1 Tax=Aspergillus steynii IBT 23096 TaxID=1392250 RepID=A0A2I2FYW0_9EURO|nr:putative MFS transporter [Aspergillus steynii IBT 23096]PLB45831.1 putative MFS transporter [Aspergillus steynii IBT 23096]